MSPEIAAKNSPKKNGLAPPKNAGGQPTKLTAEMAKYITDALGRGISIKRACIAAGVDRKSYYNWCKANGQFFHMATRAKIRGEVSLLGHIENAAATDWRAAEALLKCMYPARYAKHVVNHEGEKHLPSDDVAGELEDAAKD